MEVENSTEASEQQVSYHETQTDQYEIGDDNSSSLLNTEAPEQQEQATEEAPAETIEDNSEQISDIQEQVAKNENAIKAIKNDLKAKGVDFNQAVKEYNASGALSAKTIAGLVNAGYPEEVIQSFLDSRQALEAQFTEAVYQSAGGEESYNQLIEWARTNLPQKTIDSFNRAIDNNNLEALTLMIEGIKAKRTARMGTRNPSILGNTPAKATQRGFQSKDEMVKAFSDPRYGRDPAYMREMEMKMLYTE